MVMEKSWNVKNLQKDMAFCDQSWNFINFATEFHQMFLFFADINKFNLNLKVCIFQPLLQNVAITKFEQSENQETVMKRLWVQNLWEP